MGGRRENTLYQEHTGHSSPRKPNRRAPDHHGAVPAPPRRKQPQFQPQSHRLCNPPKKQPPPCTPDPRPGPREQLPSPPATPGAAAGVIGRQQAPTEPQGHRRCHRHGRVLSASRSQQRDGEHRDVLPPQRCSSWGTQTCPPRVCCRDHQYRLGHQQPCPSILARAQPGHPAAPRGAELIYHLQACKVPAAGGRRGQVQLSRLLLIKRRKKKKLIPPTSD